MPTVTTPSGSGGNTVPQDETRSLLDQITKLKVTIGIMAGGTVGMILGILGTMIIFAIKH